MISVLDIFAGAGGFTQGLSEASDRFRTVAAVELDPVAAETYRKNHDAAVYAGTVASWLASHDSFSDIDVIVGGPPCQGFSKLGKQDYNDYRNTLWSDYVNTVASVKPKYFVMENVETFIRKPEYDMLVNEMRHGGRLNNWVIRSWVLNAADYGAYQNRYRTIILGYRRDLEPLHWPMPTHVGRYRTVRSAFSNVPWETQGIDLPKRFTIIDGKECPGPFRSDELHLGQNYSELAMKRFVSIPPGGCKADIPDNLKMKCWLKSPNSFNDSMGRLHWDKPAVTVRTGFFKPERGRYLHPVAHRAITHYEASLLQGFPSSYEWFGSKVEIARQIGNAVPIPLGRAIGRQLAQRFGL